MRYIRRKPKKSWAKKAYFTKKLKKYGLWDSDAEKKASGVNITKINKEPND